MQALSQLAQKKPPCPATKKERELAMAAKINTTIFKDELAAILEEFLAIDIDTEEELDSLAFMFYNISPIKQYPEGAILVGKNERYIVPDFFI